VSPQAGSLSLQALRRVLGAAWWVAFPSFAVLVLALIRERACFDRLYPLPAIATRPMLAWLVAGVYLSAYGWLVAAYCFTALDTRQLLPRFGQARAVWGPVWFQLLAMLGLVALENVPSEIWIRLAHVTGCGI
jgi:hypothetical protein